MQTRKLGRSGIDASVVALGAWAIGGWMWGGTDEDESVAAIHAALDAGINFIDTAPIYGFGLSEQVVGKALKGRRDQVVLATKCGLVSNTRKGILHFRSTTQTPSPTGLVAIQLYQGPESIREEVEMSLRRLQTDYIDLYQTHWQDPTTPIEETMDALTSLRDQGKIRAIGCSNASVGQLTEYLLAGQLDADQESFSMLKRGLAAQQLPFCREHGVAVLAYSPLARGLLTGKCGPDRQFNDGDGRRQNPDFGIANRQHVQTMLAKLDPVAEAHGATYAQLAAAWAFHQPGLTHVLVGGRTPKQARENAAAGDIVLSADELALMDRAIAEYEAGRG